jgi:eukaryotic-like serine/threonine-protein kinase
MADSPSRLGQTVSHYRIVEALGAGGMGILYKAEDTRLQRFVALKFLPDDVVGDSKALARFQKEARSASALNHPHICTIYDVGEHEGQSFIAMELLDGQTLKDKIGQRPLPLASILGFSLQIADALDSAHKQGIVHRDVKPSNIFVNARGDIKVLDFGLAKQFRMDGTSTADSPTLSSSLSTPGQIVGTVAYMSPEQAQDQNVDARSDIFSLGAVIYEMSTGRRAFSGDSAAALLAGILRSNPQPAQALNPEAPAELQRLIDKCLEKDRDDRYQTATDLMVDLRRLKRQELGSSTIAKVPAVQSVAPSPRQRRWIPALIAVGVLAVVALAFVVAASFSSAAPGLLSSEQITFSNDSKGGPLVTDGARLYFYSNQRAVEMSVKGGPTAPVPSDLAGMRIVDISPDASTLLAIQPLLTNELGIGALWSVATVAGTPKRLGNITAETASWSPDGRSIAFTRLDSLSVSDANGDNVREVWKSDSAIGTPRFSPDSHRLRVTKGPRIWELDADGRNPHQLKFDWPDTADQSDGQWTPDGKHFVFRSFRDRMSGVYELIQPRWFEFWKEPAAYPLVSSQLQLSSVTPSRDSSGLFLLGGVPQGAMQVYDSGEKKFVPYQGGINASVLLVSPDRRWIAYSDFPRHNLWRSRLDGSDKLQLSTVYCFLPRWAPDSKSIVFSDAEEIYHVSVDGGPTERLTSSGDLEVSPSFGPDGKSITFSDIPFPGHMDGLKVLDLDTKKISIMPGSEGLYVPGWSPDGQYLVATGNNPLRLMLYTAKTGRWTVLKKLDSSWLYWVWAPDSKSIYVPIPAAQIGAEPVPGADNGIYRLTIADGKWERFAPFDGITPSTISTEGQPGIAPDGRLLLMSDTTVLQIYFARWNNPSDSRR